MADERPAQSFDVPRTTQRTPRTPADARLRLEPSDATFPSPTRRNQTLGPSTPTHITGRFQPYARPSGAVDRRPSPTRGKHPVTAQQVAEHAIAAHSTPSFSPRHGQRHLSPMTQSHPTPGSAASHDSPSAPSASEVYSDSREPSLNQPIFTSGHLVGGNPSKVSLMVAISVDGLFFDGTVPKRLRVPITVISSPDQNV